MKRMTQISLMVIGIAMLVTLIPANPVRAANNNQCPWCTYYQPVFITITNPTDGSYIATDTTMSSGYTVPVNLVASVTDYAGNPLNGYTILWFVDGHLLGPGNPFTATLPSNFCGGIASRQITVSAIDSGGNLVTWDGNSVLDSITVLTGTVYI